MDKDTIERIEEILKGRHHGLKQHRSGPRSRLVDAIMVLLLSRPMRSSEIAEILGLESKYIASYLSYWKTRGYVEYESGFWQITPKGEDYAREIISREASSEFDKFVTLARKIASESINQTIKDKRRASGGVESDKPLSFIVGLKDNVNKKRQERVEQASCLLRILHEELDQDEYYILEHLLLHYAKWGTTYIYVDQLSERLNADLQWLLKNLRSLQSKGLVYIYTDPRLGIRIGISKKLKEEMELCRI
ncbi:MAG: replication initiator protein WhiP [Desulfurococcales archaeon]|nr:replication initiator protein WhiP [Desulfurococcales archaeon]